MKTALREIAGVHHGDFRLTPSQNLTISGVTSEQKLVIENILNRHGLTAENRRKKWRMVSSLGKRSNPSSVCKT
jgi:sulfite reductase (NADPH) hemoprotein beta-component